MSTARGGGAAHAMAKSTQPHRTLIISRPPSGVALQAQLEVAPHVGPFSGGNTVHDGIADAAVAPRAVVADHAIAFRPQRFDGALRAGVEVVGPQAHHLSSRRV